MIRLRAARSTGRLAARSVLRHVAEWPSFSPSVVNAWVLLVTAKPPSWRDPMMTWPDEGPTLGRPHPGFFYPDPLGFWSEVRRWVTILVRAASPEISVSDAVSLSGVLHAGDDPQLVGWARERCRPVITLFLDEASREMVGVEEGTPFSIPDPHREGTTYDGWWAGGDKGVVVGKSPQHPASHRFYRSTDMDTFLSAVPLARATPHPPD